MKIKKSLLPLNIQMFGDGEDGAEEQEVDYKALYEKTKKEKDKASKEASEYKKALQAKETEDEQKARLEQERQTEIEEIIRQNKSYKLANELSKGDNFTSDEVQKLVEARQSDDDSVFAQVLNEIIKAKLEAQKTQIISEYKRNPNVPGGSNNNNNDTVVETVRGIAKQGTKPNRDRFGSYLRK